MRIENTKLRVAMNRQWLITHDYLSLEFKIKKMPEFPVCGSLHFAHFLKLKRKGEVGAISLNSAEKK